jgi:hypothetical protein
VPELRSDRAATNLGGKISVAKVVADKPDEAAKLGKR